MLKQGDRVQLVDNWRLPAAGPFPEDRLPCGAAGVVATIGPHPIDAARPPYAWVQFDDYNPPCGHGPFHIPTNFLKKLNPSVARFSIGQIVELDATGFGPGALLQTGDRGTVVRGGFMNRFGAMQAMVLWHKDGRERDMVEDRLRAYVNPADAPGRSQGAFATMQALRVVLQEEEPHAMEEVRRELERARMKAEDFAQGNAVHDGTGVTWRQWDAIQEDCLETLQESLAIQEAYWTAQ